MKHSGLRLILFARCEEASEIASAALDRELTSSERWALRLHTLVCKPCRHLVRQLKALRAMMLSAPIHEREKLSGTIAHLSTERRRQLKQMLADARDAS